MTLRGLTSYTLPVERSDWDSLLADWTSLVPARSSRWLMSRFGELFFEHADGTIGMLQVSACRYEVVARDKRDFEEWLADPDKMAVWFFAPLVDHLGVAAKVLRPDSCYSFTTPLALGGSAHEQNVSILAIRDHFIGHGKLFRQIKDLPPGAEIVAR